MLSFRIELAGQPELAGDRLQLGIASRVLQGFDGVFGGEFAHQERELTVGCHVHGDRIHLLHILRGARAATIDFHNKLNAFHVWLLGGKRSGKTNSTAIWISLSHYRFEMLATPHSRQRGLSLAVINPQDGHILCDRNPTV
jgi:hypothetical protein